MPIDPSIYSNIRLPQAPPDPMQQYGQAMQLKSLVQGQADDEAIRQAYRESGGDPDKLKQLLYGSGQYEQVIKAENAGLKTKKTKSDILKNDVELVKKFRDEADSLLPTLNAQNWVEFRNLQIERANLLSSAEMRGPAVKEMMRMPEQFDQAYIDARLKAKQAQRGDAFQFVTGTGGQIYQGDIRRGGLATPTVDGKRTPVFAPQYDPQVQADVARGKEGGKESIKIDLEQHETATSSIENLQKIGELKAHLKESNAITGMGANFLNNVERAKVLVANSEKSGKKVSDTELLDIMMGSEVFPLIKSLGIGARGMDTPAEREFLRKVMTGQINLNKETLIKMADMREAVANRAVDRWNKRIGKGELDKYFAITGRTKELLGQQPSNQNQAQPLEEPAAKPGKPTMEQIQAELRRRKVIK